MTTFPEDLTIDALRVRAAELMAPITYHAKQLVAERVAIRESLKDRVLGSVPPLGVLGEFAQKAMTLLAEKDKAEQTLRREVRRRQRMLGSQIDFEGDALMRDVKDGVIAELSPIMQRELGVTPEGSNEEDWQTYKTIMTVDPDLTPADQPDRDMHVAFLQSMNAVLDSVPDVLNTRDMRVAWYWQMMTLNWTHEIGAREESTPSMFESLIGAGKVAVDNDFSLYRKSLRRVMKLNRDPSETPLPLTDEKLYDLTFNVRLDYLLSRHAEVVARAEGHVCEACGTEVKDGD